ENTIDNDAANDEARWRLAYLLLLRGQPERAAPIARGGVRLHACPDRFGLLQCTIETRAHRPLAATAILDSTLACLRPGERDSLFTPQRLMAPDSLPPCWPC